MASKPDKMFETSLAYYKRFLTQVLKRKNSRKEQATQRFRRVVRLVILANRTFLPMNTRMITTKSNHSNVLLLGKRTVQPFQHLPTLSGASDTVGASFITDSPRKRKKCRNTRRQIMNIIESRANPQKACFKRIFRRYVRSSRSRLNSIV
jgi:hypothetical protein